MNILVITPIYPAKFNPKGTTPLVHYFTREWVEQGHNVHVVDVVAKYPRLFYLIANFFNNFIVSKLGIIIPTQIPAEYKEVNEGVNVDHIVIDKYVPHGRFSKKAIKEINKKIIYLSIDFKPNVIVGHWANPTLEVISKLKQYLVVPTGVVFHETAEQIYGYYGDDAIKFIKNIDYIGHRSYPLKKSFEKKFGWHKSFMAFSGVPENFLKATHNQSNKNFDRIRSFLFVGTLMKRKFPTEILYSLDKSYEDHSFTMTYIGNGNEYGSIQEYARKKGLVNNVVLTGRIARNQIIDFLKESQVFIMISKNEVFGLVYLEAMAFGCIPIASRNEGFDGIIIDGYNGFLCEAGNVNELTNIINSLKTMSKDKLQKISNNAMITANQYSDYKVAENYLKSFDNRCL